MSDNIEVFPGVRRIYEEGRDWLVTGEERKPTAKIVSFTPKLLQCSICMGRTHRASACPGRKREAPRKYQR